MASVGPGLSVTESHLKNPDGAGQGPEGNPAWSQSPENRVDKETKAITEQPVMAGLGCCLGNMHSVTQ